MMFPNERIVKSVKDRFPEGCKVVLNYMDDFHAPLVGAKGVVLCVDDMATIHVRWENGSELGVVYGEDSCSRVED